MLGRGGRPSRRPAATGRAPIPGRGSTRARVGREGSRPRARPGWAAAGHRVGAPAASHRGARLALAPGRARPRTVSGPTLRPGQRRAVHWIGVRGMGTYASFAAGIDPRNGQASARSAVPSPMAGFGLAATSSALDPRKRWTAASRNAGATGPGTPAGTRRRSRSRSTPFSASVRALPDPRLDRRRRRPRSGFPRELVDGKAAVGLRRASRGRRPGPAHACRAEHPRHPGDGIEIAHRDRSGGRR